MLSKVMIGVSAAMAIALLLVGKMLLAAKEENGTLIQGVETAKGVNARQALTLAEVQRNHDNLLVQIETERRKAREATKALAVSDQGLIQAEEDFEQRMATALEELSDEDLECASLFLPQPLIDGLHERTGGPD